MPDVNIRDDAFLASLVHECVSQSNDLASSLQKHMDSSPADTYLIPGEILTEIVNLLKTDAKLVSNLFIENQDILEKVQQISDAMTAKTTKKTEEPS